jgi:hypothetical protein
VVGAAQAVVIPVVAILVAVTLVVVTPVAVILEGMVVAILEDTAANINLKQNAIFSERKGPVS